MAAIKKFCGKNNDAVRVINHVERIKVNPHNNEHIDVDKAALNYRVSPERKLGPVGYYQHLLKQCYCYNRADVKTLVGFALSLPIDCPEELEEQFFQTAYEFIANRYPAKEAGIVSAVVHHDEEGERPHMHVLFVPIVKDKKHPQGKKISANECLPLREYKEFHPALQRYLREHGVPGTVMSGITRQLGGNRTIGELKNQSAEQEKQYKRTQRELAERARREIAKTRAIERIR